MYRVPERSKWCWDPKQELLASVTPPTAMAHAPSVCLILHRAYRPNAGLEETGKIKVMQPFLLAGSLLKGLASDLRLFFLLLGLKCFFLYKRGVIGS